jgi:gluconate 2-dehydrogenase subunit 3-like protein
VRVLDPVRPVFRAIAQTVVPEATRLSDADWAAVETIVERALAPRPPRLRRQLVVLIRLLQWLPLLRYGRPFTALDAARRTQFLEHMQDAPLLLLRRGFWGLRTLALMGYYARAEAAVEIGYRARPEGWEARRP